MRRQLAGMIAAHQDLHGLVLDLAAHALDLALGHHVALAEQDHLVADAIHFVQDVAGDDDVPSLLAPLLEERDGFGAGQRVEAVQRLVEDDHLRIVRRGLRQFDALPHALAVGGHRAVARVGQADGFERGHGALVALLVSSCRTRAGRSR